MQYETFLSYSRRDTAQALLIYEWLISKEISVFMDRQNLTGGKLWLREMVDLVVRKTKSILILVGPSGIGNTQQYERDLAIQRKLRQKRYKIIPVLLPGRAKLPPDFLSLNMWIDFSGYSSIPPDAQEFELLLRALRSNSSAVPASAICPYMGLETFREEDANFYFGREMEKAELVSKCSRYDFVTVVGQSGTGKSSLVQAGLLPHLRRQAQKRLWRAISLRPGPRPLLSLVSEISLSTIALGNKSGVFRSSKQLSDTVDFALSCDIAKMVEFLFPDKNRENYETLLHIDSWEELYTPHRAVGAKIDVAKSDVESETSQFIEFLINASERKLVKVVATVRADAYETLLRHPELGRVGLNQQVNLRPMSRDSLKRAIVEPAKKANLIFESEALVEQVLNDAGDEPGVLPLLQYALKEMWDRREGNVLTERAYTRTGRVTGVLPRSADKAFEELDDEEKEEAPKLFLSMVSTSDGQTERLVRAPMPDNHIQRRVVDKMSGTDVRLLTIGVQPISIKNLQASNQPQVDGFFNLDQECATVEIAHSALIRTWPKLRSWIDENRRNMELRSELKRMRDEWQRRERNEDLLIHWRLRLEAAIELLKNPGDVYVEDLREYVEHSADRLKKQEEEKYRSSVLQHAYRMETVARNILKQKFAVAAVAKDIKQHFSFDFVLVQIIDRFDQTIGTVHGIGQGREEFGIGKHYLHSSSNVADIQAFVATCEPFQIEVISGNDDRFDSYIFERFGHRNMSRAFIPVVLCEDVKYLNSIRWLQTNVEPNTDTPAYEDKRTVLIVDRKDYGNLLESEKFSVLGTLEVGFFNHSHDSVVKSAVDVFKKAASRSRTIYDTSLDAVLDTFVELVAEMLDADATSAGIVFDPTRHAFAFRSTTGVSDLPEMRAGTDPISRMATNKGRAVVSPKGADKGDGALFWDNYPLAVEEGFKAIIAVPIIGNLLNEAEFDQLLVRDEGGIYEGLLHVAFKRDVEMTSSNLALVEYISRRAADAIAYARVFIRIQEEERRASSLNRITVALSRGLQSDDILNDIAGNSLNMFAADLVTVFEYDLHERTFRKSAGIAGRLYVPRHSVECQSDDSFAPKVIMAGGEDIFENWAAGSAILGPSFTQTARGVERFLVRESIVSVAGIVLRAGEDSVGVMFVNFRRRHEFASREKSFMKAVAAIAAIALRNRQLIRART